LRAAKILLEQKKQGKDGSSSYNDNSNDDDDDDGIAIKYLPSVCYESELIVEEEPYDDLTTTPYEDDDQSKCKISNNKEALFSSNNADDDATLSQSDLNAALAGSSNGNANSSLSQAATGVTDPTTLAFYARTAIGGKEEDVRDQCLRYCRWPDLLEVDGSDGDGVEVEDDDVEEGEGGNGPLWLSSDHRPPSSSSSSQLTFTTPHTTTTTTASSCSSKTPSENFAPFPPPCQYCGAPRAFEFQILPQMLHYLLRNPEDDDTSSNNNNNNAKSSSPREVLTEAERAVLLEAKSKIESGVELPEGFLEEHERVVKNARDALLLGNGSGKGVADTTANGDNTMDEYNESGSKVGLDWGTIAIYTCTASCGDGGVVSSSLGGGGGGENVYGAYREEAAWMQPPLD